MRTLGGSGAWGPFGGSSSCGSGSGSSGSTDLARRLRSSTGPAALPGPLRSLTVCGGAAGNGNRIIDTGMFVGVGFARPGSVRPSSVVDGLVGRGGDGVTTSQGRTLSAVESSIASVVEPSGRSEEIAHRPRLQLPATRIRDARLQRLEAVLMLAREPLNSRKLAQFANLADGTEARTLVRKLNEALDAAGRAFRVEEVASGYQLFTRPGFASWLRKLGHIPAEMRLSAPALETLAVIAYRQPVPRADIEAIRGVNCGEILRQLMERDLARIAGRSDELGRPFLYGTTRRFLQIFGLVDLDELPRADKLRGAIPRLSEESGSLG